MKQAEGEEHRGDNGEMRFHYHREERLSRHGRSPRVRRSGGILRGNRSMLILLLDLLLVLAPYFFAIFFLFPDRDRADLDGWSLHLSGSRVGRDAAAMLVMRRTEPVDPDQEILARITFRAGEFSVSAEELLPERGERTVRVTLHGAGESTERIEAEVIIGGRKAALHAGMDD